MCGITGFWSFANKLSEASLNHVVTNMASHLASRGPDSAGTWLDVKANIAFGHRRLAIVDLSQSGHQPMTSASGRYVITYNGEVYNAAELRDNLIKKGIVFKGFSDTEVIVSACEIYGVEETPKLLVGMFAYAVWDTLAQKLYLVRDRLGIKPLYWGINNETLFFGSQLKCFYPHPAWQGKLNKNALLTYFRFGYITGSASIYENVHKLLPGTLAVVSSKDDIVVNPYWQVQDIISPVQPSLLISPREWVDRLDGLLADAVNKCLIADVPVGAFLSGGIDSSAVVALMQAQSSRPVQTYSIGFQDEGYNEAVYAKAVASHLGTDHIEHYVSSQDALDIIPTISEWCDEPFGDSSQIPTFLVSRLARQNVKVCLSGDGGDELFAGYSRYFQARDRWNRLSLLPFSKMIAATIKYFSSQEWNSLGNLIPNHKLQTYIKYKISRMADLMTCHNRHDMYLKLVSLWENPEDLIPGSCETLPLEWLPFAGLSSRSFIEEMQYIDTKTYLPDDILSKVDYASMAVSLECRVPLLDHRVVEFAWSIPEKLKTCHPQGKWILREVLKKYVPPSLTERPKMGFGVPVDKWLRGSLRPWAEELLSTRRLSEDGLLNPDPIRKRWKEHVSGTRNWHYSLWPVLMFQAWRERYKFCQ